MDIKEKLLALPEEIENFRMQLLEKEEELNALQELIKMVELSLVDDIANATNEEGKPLYSNDSKRTAELEKRKTADLRYYDLNKPYKQKSLELKKQKISLETLYNTQENLRAICRLGDK